jgi:hypothetical protein
MNEDGWSLTVRERFGRDPNLETPATFNEKIHWLRLHYKLPEMTRLADKYEVRTHVAARVGGWLQERYLKDFPLSESISIQRENERPSQFLGPLTHLSQAESGRK